MHFLLPLLASLGFNLMLLGPKIYEQNEKYDDVVAQYEFLKIATFDDTTTKSELEHLFPQLLARKAMIEAYKSSYKKNIKIYTGVAIINTLVILGLSNI